ncbi:indolepyruvate oxidoreductase subunit beta family protein [Nitrospirillum sp. BR 11163]|uniref:indolepyruvate oxidoreductase subunit beta family protein n=1 Tax=Nitrospirillum sp. BR 11163 TaxID=3104323 RepID=UPI002AFEBF76|nr:indolepyruvate oxidoreductase subunit beta family protein [Nitrospirillum sp. BR 11163]MEA1674587.1 indolepyruvate oxidoreductase subunit beta family protein [Nitrospirillum sp. BR 11163]
MGDNIVRLPLAAAGAATERPISIAIVAMGGQGGGVLSGWIVQLAENAGWVAQSTSVPGVAQRTGATIYYIEMMPLAAGRKPILAQMPTPGDVDVVLASEFMEAGRSILRGIVTPERTILIASDHRSFAISEKSAPGNGIADSDAVADAIGVTARRQIIFNMDELAARNGSVISSAMFGALAGSGGLPFDRDAYHAVIRQDGKGVAASLKTFDAAFERAANPSPPHVGAEIPAASRTAGVPSSSADPRVARLLDLLRTSLPEAAWPMAWAGLRKVVDYQDERYGTEYLEILARLHAVDRQAGGQDRGHDFTVTAAKYVANAMTYDDVIRVADLKTRAGRRSRIASEVGAGPHHVLTTTEFMHPRMEEIAGLLPAGFARWLKRQGAIYAWLDRRVNKGRRVRTYSPAWFLTLYTLGGMRWLRRRSLRHAEEVAHREVWLACACDLVRKDYVLGGEVLKCRRLVKGYSDTHARGLSRFDKVIAEIRRLAHRDDAANWARRLRETAIKDGEGGDLDGLIRTIRSFC